MQYPAFSLLDLWSLWAIPISLMLLATIWWFKNAYIAQEDSLLAVGGDETGVEAAKLGKIRVTELFIFPIKSCGGASVKELSYTPEGIEDDRKWCILNPQTGVVVTARDVSKLVLVETQLKYDRSLPYKGELVIIVPFEPGRITFSVPIDPMPDVLQSWETTDECTLWGIKSNGYICQSLRHGSRTPSEILSEYCGKEVLLVMKGDAPRPCKPTAAFPTLEASATFQDGYPLHLASEESLIATNIAIRNAAKYDIPEKIGQLDGKHWKSAQVTMEWFRPNIVIRGAGGPFAEDTWQKVSFHPSKPDPEEDVDESRMITFVQKCARCLVPNIDPKTGVRDDAVPFKVLAKHPGRVGLDPLKAKIPCFGTYGVPEGNGVFRLRDYVAVHELSPPGV